MLFETRLRRLEERYRARLSAAGAAQPSEPGSAADPGATAQAIERANAQSKVLEQRIRDGIEPTEIVQGAAPEAAPEAAEPARESSRLEGTATV